jgi:hypothetical protein
LTAALIAEDLPLARSVLGVPEPDRRSAALLAAGGCVLDRWSVRLHLVDGTARVCASLVVVLNVAPRAGRSERVEQLGPVLELNLLGQRELAQPPPLPSSRQRQQGLPLMVGRDARWLSYDHVHGHRK